MADGGRENALVKVSDIFGASRPAVRLIEAVERGVGNFLQPWQMRRVAKTEIANFEGWQLALKKYGLLTTSAELNLQDRAAVRLIAQETQRQNNREAVAFEAAKEFKEAIEGDSEIGDMPTELDIEWIDRFWRLAQDVTNSDIQALWGRILARQTTGRSAYSARGLETICLLSREEISYLERLASFLWSVTFQGKPNYFILHGVNDLQGKRIPAEISLKLRGVIGELHKEILGPAGILLDSGSGWAHDASVDTNDGVANVTIAKKQYRLAFANKVTGPTTLGACVRVGPLGSEIFSLINPLPNVDYIAALDETFKFVNIDLKEV